MSWTEQQLADGRAHWAAVKLASGGGPRQGMPLPWTLINKDWRAVAIAKRSGMPIGLIILFAQEPTVKVMRWLTICDRLADLDHYRPTFEAVTERVPMWRERPRRRRVEAIAGAVEQVTA